MNFLTRADKISRLKGVAVPMLWVCLLVSEALAMAPVRRYDATVVQVHDGDTVAAYIDLGFDLTIRQSIRLEGIDAPELSTDKGKVVAKYLQGLLMTKSVVVETTGKKEKYGRLMATIWLGSTNVNELLVEKGFAKPYHGEKRTP